MARHTAGVRWERGDAVFSDNRYSRAHRWLFDGGLELPASSSPHVVRVPLSDPGAVDPEEAFVAALASCHMLWFLSLAAARGWVVDHYEDEAEGEMRRNDGGKLAMTHVTLHPRIAYHGDGPTAEDERALHHEAHEACFLANSVHTEITVAL